jgi:hypothetical protein
MIRGKLSLDKIRSMKASGKDAPVHPMDHQVQCQSQTPMPTKQATQGTAGPEGDNEVDHSNE